jgi:hypothetical protein
MVCCCCVLGKKNVTGTPTVLLLLMLCKLAFEEWEQKNIAHPSLHRRMGATQGQVCFELEEASSLSHRLGERPPSLPPHTSLILLLGNTHTTLFSFVID